MLLKDKSVWCGVLLLVCNYPQKVSDTQPCRCYPGVGDLDASDDEDTVLLENPAYENLMRKCLKVHRFASASSVH